MKNKMGQFCQFGLGAFLKRKTQQSNMKTGVLIIWGGKTPSDNWDPSGGGLIPSGKISSVWTRHLRVDLFRYSPPKYVMMSCEALNGGGLYGVDHWHEAAQTRLKCWSMEAITLA